MSECCLIDIPVIRDTSGAIGVIQPQALLPFEVRRVYYLFDLDAGSKRGEHAHRSLFQFVVCLSGSCRIFLHDGAENSSFLLDRPTRGLLIGPGHWRALGEFAGGTTLMVLASEEYRESDYIRDWDEFLSWKSSS